MKAQQNLSQWQKRHIEHVKNYVAKAITQFDMIDDEDKVLAAVSGGKDSLEKIHPKAKFNLFNAMHNIDEEYLPGGLRHE